MPVITLESSPLRKEQKQQLIERLTEVTSNVLNLPESAIIVYLKENSTDNIGVGGKLLSETK